MGLKHTYLNVPTESDLKLIHFQASIKQGYTIPWIMFFMFSKANQQSVYSYEAEGKNTKHTLFIGHLSQTVRRPNVRFLTEAINKCCAPTYSSWKGVDGFLLRTPGRGTFSVSCKLC